MKAYEYVELAVEDYVASDLGGQQPGVEMPAEDPIRLPILECALLPLGGPDALWTPRIQNQHLRCNALGLRAQDLALIGEEQPVQVRSEESADRLVGERQAEGIGPDDRHLRNSDLQGLERPLALIDGKSRPWEQSSERAGTRANIDETDWWKIAKGALKLPGLGCDLLNGHADAKAGPIGVGVGDTG